MEESSYKNILSAIGDRKLSVQQEADNYTEFSRLMKEGVYLPDLRKRLSELEDKVRDIETSRTAELDKELFAVMEASVRNEPDVKQARQRLTEAKTDVLTELCMKDQRFREALDGYRTAVNSAYVHKKESSQPGEGSS